MRPGSIVALDLWRKSHRRALPRMIKGLKHRGFSFKTINALEDVRPVRWDVTMSAGATGPTVGLLDKRLRSKSYPAGAANNVFDYALLQSVYAFEKVHRMPRDGVVLRPSCARSCYRGGPEHTSGGRGVSLKSTSLGRCFSR